MKHEKMQYSIHVACNNGICFLYSMVSWLMSLVTYIYHWSFEDFIGQLKPQVQMPARASYRNITYMKECCIFMETFSPLTEKLGDSIPNIPV